MRLASASKLLEEILLYSLSTKQTQEQLLSILSVTRSYDGRMEFVASTGFWFSEMVSLTSALEKHKNNKVPIWLLQRR